MIVEKWGLPKEEVSCPSCGRIYGYRRTKVCVECEECEPCCKKRPINKCSGLKHVAASTFVEKMS
jgi:hypothetical protein